MDVLDQQVGSDHRLLPEMIDDRRVVPYADQSRCIPDLVIGRQVLDQSKLPDRGDLRSVFTHSRVICALSQGSLHQNGPPIHHLYQLVMDLPIRRDEMRLIRGISSPAEIGPPPTGLFYDQETRRAVPGLKLMLIKAIESPGSDPAKIHGRRPKPANRYARADQP